MWTSSILIAAVLLARLLCRGKISMRLQYGLWLLVAVKLLLFPIPYVDGGFSVMRLAAQTEEWWNRITAGNAPYEEGITDLTGNNAGQEGSGENDRPEGALPGWVPVSGAEAAAGNEKGKNSVGWEHETDAPEAQDEGNVGNIVWLIGGAGTLVALGWLCVSNIVLAVKLRRKRMRYHGVDSLVPVYLVENIASPFLFGRAIYVMPEITADERVLRHVIVHEEQHFRQGDVYWCLLRCLCLALYWWHPLVWVAAYASKQDCELACDEGAMLILGEQERIPYGKTLLRLVEGHTGPGDYFSMTTAMSGGAFRMKQRIKRIAGKPRVLYSVCGLAVVVLLIVFTASVTSGGKPESGGTENGINVERADETENGINVEQADGTENGINVEQASDEITEPHGVLTIGNGVVCKGLVMFDSDNGWLLTQENEVQRTTSGLAGFTTVHTVPAARLSDGFAEACFLDENTAYTVSYAEDAAELRIIYTRDGGASWQETEVSYEGLGGIGSAYLAFVDAEQGYLLYCSDPALGQMNKVLFGTVDGGASWQQVAELTEAVRGYPTGIDFADRDHGFVTVTYHGQEDCVYQTNDGGISWEAMEMPFMGNEQNVRYRNGYAPYFYGEGRQQGILVLGEMENTERLVLYATSDGGNTWSMQGHLSVEGIRRYTGTAGLQGFVINQEGAVYELIQVLEPGEWQSRPAP